MKLTTIFQIEARVVDRRTLKNKIVSYRNKQGLFTHIKHVINHPVSKEELLREVRRHIAISNREHKNKYGGK